MTETSHRTRRRFLVDDEPLGVLEMPVLVFEGLIDEPTRRVLADNHVRVDRSPGVYRVVRNASLFGIRGSWNYRDLRAVWAASSVVRPDWEPVGPVVERAGYTYAMVVPTAAVAGFFLSRWEPSVNI